MSSSSLPAVVDSRLALDIVESNDFKPKSGYN